MQVYLPEALYRQVKKHKLPASELLQGAVRAELRRRELEKEALRYLKELRAEVGEPDAEQVEEAEQIVRRLQRRGAAKKHGQ